MGMGVVERRGERVRMWGEVGRGWRGGGFCAIRGSCVPFWGEDGGGAVGEVGCVLHGAVGFWGSEVPRGGVLLTICARWDFWRFWAFWRRRPAWNIEYYVVRVAWK